MVADENPFHAVRARGSHSHKIQEIQDDIFLLVPWNYYRSRHKHLRCFPQCTAGIHRDRSFCGDSLIVNVIPSTPQLAATLDPSNTSVYGEFHKLERTPILLSTNATVVSADLSDKIVQATFVHREGDGLRFAFNPPRKWEYRTKVKQTDLHTFTVAVAINRVIVISQSVQPFRIVPIAKNKGGGEDDGEVEEEDGSVADESVAEDSFRSVAHLSSGRNVALAATPTKNSSERPHDKLDEMANSNSKKRRKLQGAFSKTLQEPGQNAAVARISDRSAVLQTHHRPSPAPIVAMGPRGSPSMPFMFPMGNPGMNYMPYLSQSVGGPHQTDYALPYALQPRAMFMSTLQPQPLSYMPYNTQPNSMMAFQQLDYPPTRPMINIVQVPGGSAMSMPPQMIQFGSPQQPSAFSPSFSNVASAHLSGSTGIPNTSLPEARSDKTKSKNQHGAH